MAERSLNPTAASLLGFLHRGPSSGWDLLQTAREQIGQFWSITPSQVYRELAAMEAAGLIRAGQSGPRERRPYELTEPGRQAFAEWLSQTPGSEVIRYPLLLTLAFGAHLDPATLRGFLAEHRRVHADRLSGYHQVRAELAGNPAARYGLATLEFGVRYETAVLDWIDTLPEEIRPAVPD